MTFFSKHIKASNAHAGDSRALNAYVPISGSIKLFELDALDATTIIFDGRIDNAGNEDAAAFVLRHYEDAGAESAEKLLGDFTFVILDKANRRIVAARDRFGVKPFYYCIKDERFYFSTNLPTLINSLNFSPETDIEAIGFYLCDLFFNADKTFYKGVFRLPPGHTLVFDQNGVSVMSYWQLVPGEPIKYRDQSEYVNHFEELFTSAVSCRLAKNTTGILLSGGVDSSAIAIATNEILASSAAGPNLSKPGSYETFSLEFNTPDTHDHGRLQTVLPFLNCKQHIFHPEPAYELIEFEQGDDYREIAYAPNFFMFRQMYARAQQRNISVMLTGLGGDDVFGLPDEHNADLLKAGKIPSLYRELYALSETPWHFLRYFATTAIKPLVPVRIFELYRKLVKRRAPFPINEEFERKYELIAQARAHHSSKHFQFSEKSKQALCFRLFSWGGYPFGVEQEQRLAAHYNIELRWPLFDWRLIDFALRIPAEQLQENAWSKLVLRRYTEKKLPRQISFGHPYQFYSPFRARAMLRQRADFEELLEDAKVLSLGIVTASGLKQLLAASYKNEDFAKLLKFVYVENWLRSRRP